MMKAVKIAQSSTRRGFASLLLLVLTVGSAQPPAGSESLWQDKAWANSCQLAPGLSDEIFKQNGMQGYSYGGVAEEAIRQFRQGWTEILIYGRWTEAERCFRNAVALEPEFVLGKSLVGRITRDLAERRTLLREIRANRHAVDADGRLILDVFLLSLESMNTRDEGGEVSIATRTSQADLALSNFDTFANKYPREIYILIELIEWTHAVRGAAAGLEIIKDAEHRGLRSPFFTYYRAMLYADLGAFDKATSFANSFAAELDEASLPQPYYVKAYVHHKAGRHSRARELVSKAVTLDPNHLTARQLHSEIEDQ